jgi:hypothetical protein
MDDGTHLEDIKGNQPFLKQHFKVFSADLYCKNKKSSGQLQPDDIITKVLRFQNYFYAVVFFIIEDFISSFCFNER